MTVSKKTKRPLFKEFQLLDLFPYCFSAVMIIGSFYILVQFLKLFPY